MAITLTPLPPNFGKAETPGDGKVNLAKILAELQASILATSQEAVMRQARGVLGETFNVAACVGSLAMVSGVVYYNALPLLAGQTITNLTLFVQAAGVSLTLSKLGLYDASLNRLALSADQGTAWQSVGNKTAPMITPYIVPASGLYYAAAFATGASTMPSVTRGSSGSIADGGALGSGAKMFGSQTAQTDLPTTGVMTTSIAATQFMMWVAAS